MNEREKLCYLAGLMDGEGSFFVQAHKNSRGIKYREAVVALGNSDRRMVEWIKSNYGGYIQHQRARPEKKRNEYFIYKLIGKKAVGLALALEPYLITKKAKAHAIQSNCSGRLE
jgi:hypothetical protein